MRSFHDYGGVGILCGFFILVFGFAFFFSRESITYIVAGEDSVGSWMSGTLLTMCATITGIIAMKRKWYPWLIFTIFFIALAIDENFMIHEAMKRTLVFTNYEQTGKPNDWIGEIPIIVASLFGALIASILWTNLDNSIKWIIPMAAALGSASVVMDVMAVGVLWEDLLKLIAELLVTCALILELKR
jgi:hypothetical protein